MVLTNFKRHLSTLMTGQRSWTSATSPQPQALRRHLDHQKTWTLCRMGPAVASRLTTQMTGMRASLAGCIRILVRLSPCVPSSGHRATRSSRRSGLRARSWPLRVSGALGMDHAWHGESGSKASRSFPSLWPCLWRRGFTRLAPGAWSSLMAHALTRSQGCQPDPQRRLRKASGFLWA